MDPNKKGQDGQWYINDNDNREHQGNMQINLPKYSPSRQHSPPCSPFSSTTHVRGTHIFPSLKEFWQTVGTLSPLFFTPGNSLSREKARRNEGIT